MKTKNFLLLFGLTLLTACGGASWREFSSEEGAFSVLMPKNPSVEVQTVDTPLGPIDIRLFSAELSDIAFVVGYSDYPSAFVAQSNPVVVLNGARDGAVANVQGKLLSENVIFLDGYPGRELRIEGPDAELTAVSRIFLVNNRLYQAMVVVPVDQSSTNEISTFLESFALIK